MKPYANPCGNVLHKGCNHLLVNVLVEMPVAARIHSPRIFLMACFAEVTWEDESDDKDDQDQENAGNTFWHLSVAERWLLDSNVTATEIEVTTRSQSPIKENFTSEILTKFMGIVRPSARRSFNSLMST